MEDQIKKSLWSTFAKEIALLFSLFAFPFMTNTKKKHLLTSRLPLHVHEEMRLSAKKKLLFTTTHGVPHGDSPPVSSVHLLHLHHLKA